MYQNKIEFNPFGVAREAQRINEEANKKRRIINTVCNRCKNITHCPGGIPGCGGFIPKNVFNK